MISPVMPTYARAPIEFDRGEGSWLIATDGTRYLDFGAGIAVTALGHAHPKLVTALENQARRVWHVSNLYEIPEQRRLAERLVEATFADTVFVTNSGAEAMECSIKTARKYWSATGEDRVEIVTIEGAFHGRTIGAISAAGAGKLVDGFGPMLPGFRQVPFGDIQAMRATVSDRTAAVFVEPVQGEGGIRPLEAEYLRELRRLCDETGALLGFDEVQSGMGRTGHLFAHEAAGITPDIMAIAKGIGGGFPLGACLATEEAARGMTPGTHGSTYGGNPLACAVGLAVLEEVLSEGFLDDVRRKAGRLMQSLAGLADAHPGVIADVRGAGLLLGLKLVDGTAPGKLVEAGREAGVLTVPAGDNVVRILPPLTVTEDEIGAGIERLDRALTAMEREAAA
ncbi:MAG: aspartate aminotransferase family protein [Pseudomonadota bacterium]